jgi:hypothetical protein
MKDKEREIIEMDNYLFFMAKAQLLDLIVTNTFRML